METRLLEFAQRFSPWLKTASDVERHKWLNNLFGIVYATPLAIAGVAWLVAVADAALLRAQWQMLCLTLVLLFIFERLDFRFFTEVVPGIYSDWQTALDTVITWAAALLFGYVALWLALFHLLTHYIRKWLRTATAAERWQLMRNCTLNVAAVTLVNIIALLCYERWGGVFPLPALTFAAVLPAFHATLLKILLEAVVWVPYLFYVTSTGRFTEGAVGTLTKFWIVAMGSRILIDPFALLAAGLYVQNGLGGYLAFVAVLLLTSLLAHWLSRAAQRSHLRSRELERLERLGRAIINAPADASTLPQILQKHVVGMFPESSVEIRLFPQRTLFRHPSEQLAIAEAVWDWLRRAATTHHFPRRAILPWDKQLSASAIIVAPIMDIASTAPLGGIYLSRKWGADTVIDLVPAIHSLASHISSALYAAEVYEQNLAHHRLEQELALAGKIQASFLPKTYPQIPGWQMTAILKPAKETSGDFFDFILLPDDRLGILIADVADKGMGAALYMASIRSLIRIYAAEYDTQPEAVLCAANARILMDTPTGMFATAFYGILELAQGTLTYCNAGHLPPYLFYPNGGAVQDLRRTGMPLGIQPEARWEQKVAQFAPGATLLLYTDGITDAEDDAGSFFGRERLLQIAQANLNGSAQQLLDTLVAQVRAFMGAAAQLDDITLMIIARD